VKRLFGLKVRFFTLITLVFKIPQKRVRCEEEVMTTTTTPGFFFLRSLFVVLVLFSFSSLSSFAVVAFEDEVEEKTTTSLSFASSSEVSSSLDGIPVSNTISVDPTRVSQISWQPNAVKYEKFLSNSECDYLIEKTFSLSSSSSSSSVNLVVEREGDSVVKDIERRLAEWTHTPSSHGEKLRVYKHDLRTRETSLRPLYSKVYAPFEREKNVGRINDMHLGTVVLVLKDESRKEGEEEFSSNGVIMFPNGNSGHRGGDSGKEYEQGRRTATTCEDIDASLFLKAKRGDAILWLHTTRDQKDDGNATGVGECVYAGGKVGEKWTAVKYLHLVTTQK
jgi:prolyl 4-hydroxylase